MVTEKFVKELVDAGVVGGGVKAKIYEKSINANGIVVDGAWDSGTTFYFDTTLGVPLGATILCDGTEYRYDGNAKLTMQSDTNVDGIARWKFFALYSSSMNTLLYNQKLNASAIKFVVFYIPLENIESEE